jgi:hypothetical protein
MFAAVRQDLIAAMLRALRRIGGLLKKTKCGDLCPRTGAVRARQHLPTARQ